MNNTATVFECGPLGAAVALMGCKPGSKFPDTILRMAPGFVLDKASAADAIEGLSWFAGSGLLSTYIVKRKPENVRILTSEAFYTYGSNDRDKGRLPTADMVDGAWAIHLWSRSYRDAKAITDEDVLNKLKSLVA